MSAITEYDVGATRERLGPVGVWLGALMGVPAEVERPVARRIEELGFGSLFVGERIGGKEAMAHQAVLLAATDHIVVGKPAEAFFRAALDDLGADAGGAVMVGDDIESDVLGAQALGVTGVLVRTGKFRAGDLERREGRPDHVIDGIGDLPALLESLADPA